MEPNLIEYWATWRKYAKAILIMTFMLVVGTVWFDPSAAIGALIGGVIAFLNFRLLALDVQRTVEKPPQEAQKFAFFRYLIRFLTVAVMLVILLLHPWFGLSAFVAAIPPLFSVKLTLAVETMIRYFGKLAKNSTHSNQKGG